MSLPVKLGSKPLIKINFDKNVVILEQETGMEPVKTDWFLFKEKKKSRRNTRISSALLQKNYSRRNKVIFVGLNTKN